MKIFLKNNWANFIDIDTELDDNYVWRDIQVEHLKNTIIHNNSWSILISWERWTWKTAFVYKVLKELKQEKPEKVIPIIVNVNQIYKSEEKFNNNILLENLIRRLFSVLKDNKYIDNDIKSKISELYNKVEWEYLIEKKYGASKIDFKNTSNKIINSIETSINKKEIIKIFAFFWIIFWIPNFFSLYIINIISQFKWPYEKLFLFLIISLFWFIILYILFSKIKIFNTNFKEEKNEEKASNEAYEYYKKDKTIWSLEYDLNFTLDTLNNQWYIVIFVIDELDKITKEGEISNLIKMYKNLFTLSKANFIFITDQKFYLELIQKDKTNDESPTLFNFKYYLDYPSFNDLRNYFSKIIDKIEKEKWEQEKYYYNYLLFISNNDFFKLKENIHSIIIYKDWQWYIDSNQLENNDKYIEEKVKLYSIFEEIYNKYKSDNIRYYHKNYQDLKDLFIELWNKFNSPIIIDKNEKWDLLLNVITLLERTSVITKKDNMYLWTGNFNSLLSINSIDYKTKDEQLFINKYLKYIEIINRILRIGLYPENYDEWKTETFYTINPWEDWQEFTWNIWALDLYNKYKKDFQLLNKWISNEFIPFDILNQNIIEINNSIKSLENNYYEIFKNILRYQFKEYSYFDLMNNYISVENNILNPKIVDKIRAFKWCYFKSSIYRILLVNNFNISKNFTSDDIKYLDDENIILVNVFDDKFNEKTDGCIYYDSQKVNNKKTWTSYVRQVTRNYRRIVNIKHELYIKNMGVKEFESFYFWLKNIRQYVK